MFDLTGDVPTSFVELEASLEAGVRRRVGVPPGMRAVVAQGQAYPEGERLIVGLDRCTVRVDADGVPEHLKPPTLSGDRSAGPRFGEFIVSADPLHLDVAGAGVLDVSVSVTGADVAFDVAATATGGHALVPASGGVGGVTAEVSVAQADLFRVIEHHARAEAATRGVVLDRFQADVATPAPDTAVVTGRVTGSKRVAFFNASFAVNFRAEVVAEADASGALVGRVRDLALTGDGTIMGVILKMAQPVVERVKARPLPLSDVLAAAGVSGLTVRRVEVRSGSRLALRAELGG